MIVTEEEAKTKRCCGPSGTGRLDPTAEVTTFVHRERLCIGSACMAWRPMIDWATAKGDIVSGFVHGEADSQKRGFCGYAGG